MSLNNFPLSLCMGCVGATMLFLIVAFHLISLLHRILGGDYGQLD